MIKFEWNGVVFLMTDLGGGKLGQSIPPHAHAKGCYELHFVTGGKGILITDDKEIELKKDDFFITGPNIAHSQDFDKSNPIEDVFILIQVKDGSQKNYVSSVFLEHYFCYFEKTDNSLAKKLLKEYKEKKNSPKYIYIEKDCECPDEMNEACITQKSKSKTTKNTTESEDKEENDLISINSANIDELQKINGIGKSKAESIIKYREENGDFKKIDDIKNVTGIGDSLFEKIKDQITV